VSLRQTAFTEGLVTFDQLRRILNYPSLISWFRAKRFQDRQNISEHPCVQELAVVVVPESGQTGRTAVKTVFLTAFLTVFLTRQFQIIEFEWDVSTGTTQVEQAQGRR